MSFPAGNRIERFDPEGTKSPEGEWRSEKRPETPGPERENGLAAMSQTLAGANRRGMGSSQPSGSLERIGVAKKQQVGNFDLAMVAWKRAVVASERKVAANSRLRLGRASRRTGE